MKTFDALQKFLVQPPLPVGSRVTCDPPVLDTDEDFLCLVRQDAPEGWCDWPQEGSIILDVANSLPVDEQFIPYRHGSINLITTRSRVFYRRFVAASACAKRFNLLDKADRVTLFQAVLYGN